MTRLSRLQFLGVAVVFHLLYICSIFDTYFVSPVVNGMNAYRVETPEPPAKRVVLFVADGLRADKAFQNFPDPSPNASSDSPAAQVPRHLAPFLRSRVLNHGTFGVSHTRVPTESRPGHVALLAGLYEDVSAVTTGWKLNPVMFDSVLNRSRHTWSWGSPDILPMFAEGAVPGRVDTYMYSAEAEDYSKDATELDTWVFDRVKLLFNSAENDGELERELRQDQNVFFLHLLGLDTSGHSYRPYSREYLHNIQVVDEGVREITGLMETFFGDDKTAFVFTADHGMSDWGSHGDGHPDNTRTPLIAWGSGIASPRKSTTGNAGGHDYFSADWDLNHIQRNDVAQADIAVLMAYLAGIDFPVNSVGRLPLAYINTDDSIKAEAMLVNSQEILEIYRVKENQKKTTRVWFRPFNGLPYDHSTHQMLGHIRKTIDRGELKQAIRDCDNLMQLGLEGLRYLQTYDWLFLRALITVGYLGWIAFSLTAALDQYVLNGKTEARRSVASKFVLGSVLAALFAALYMQNSPYQYYAYSIFPVLFWEEVLARRETWIGITKVTLKQVSANELVERGLSVMAFGVLLEVIVQSYYYRKIYTLAYVLAIYWPVLYGFEFFRANWIICLRWALLCAAMSIFTFLPAMKTEDINLITIGGLIMFVLGACYSAFETTIVDAPAPNRISRTILTFQIGLLPLAILVTRSAVTSLQSKTGLPFGTQMAGWAILVTSFILPLLHCLQPGDSNYSRRLAIVFFAFAPMFIILTISYEGLFYVSISCTLFTWVQIEYRIHRFHSDITPEKKIAHDGDKNRSLTFSDARIALFFLFLLHSAFFSTGNIASISSFSLDAVLRLIPVFDPFSQSALLILKILAPFALVSANLGILTKKLRLRAGALFTLVMGMSDYLTLRFFWAVKDEGSWLEIGESITVFVLASLLCVFVAALEMIGELFVGGVESKKQDGAPTDADSKQKVS